MNRIIPIAIALVTVAVLVAFRDSSATPIPPPQPIETQLILIPADEFFDGQRAYSTEGEIDRNVVRPMLKEIRTTHHRETYVGVFKADPSTVCALFVGDVEEDLAASIAARIFPNYLAKTGDILWRVTRGGNLQIDIMSLQEYEQLFGA